MGTIKERPILFSAPMVRALLAGTKTQTRRIVKPQPPAGVDVRFAPIYCGPDVENDPRSVLAWRKPGWFEIEKHYCPYGQPGDRLWVKETWRPLTDVMGAHGPTSAEVMYAADDSRRWCNIPPEEQAKANKFLSGRVDGRDKRWCPSLFCFGWASRITLEITGVRVERLQAISHDDAEAEGIEGENEPTGGDDYHAIYRDYMAKKGDEYPWFKNDAIASYRSLWESINGPGSWDKNPWVWVVEFKRITP